MILVTGATGRTGGEIVKALTSKGERVRALVRDPDRAKSIEGQNVEIAVGDLEKPETIAAALQGVDKAVLVSSEGDKLAELHSNFVSAAKSAGVGQIVRISILVADPDSMLALGKWHGEADQNLIESSVPYTILRPAAFMQNTLMSAPTVASEGKLYGLTGDGKVGFIDIRDVASVAASVLTGEGHEGKIYPLTGPESLSMGDIADKLSTVLGKGVEYVNVGPEQVKASMTMMGMPEYVADAWIQLFGMVAQGAADMTTPFVQEITGNAPRTYDDFAKDHIQMFKGM